jgi:predicted O-methyltransferase YrrM
MATAGSLRSHLSAPRKESTAPLVVIAENSFRAEGCQTHKHRPDPNEHPRRQLMTVDNVSIVDQLLRDRPAFHRGGERNWNSLPQTLEAIRNAVECNHVTLETGVGASTVIFATCGAYHTAISPDGEEHRRVLEYCSQIDVDTSRLTFVEGLSDDELPRRLTRERTLDVAFIDGAHSFPFPEVDWFYVTRSLKVGGCLVMDDIPIPAVMPLFRHMQFEHNWELEGVLDNRAAAFRLLAVPEPEDWPAQRFNDSYPDYSFADLHTRFGLEVRHRVARARAGMADRYPTLRKAYRGIVDGNLSRAAR